MIKTINKLLASAVLFASTTIAAPAAFAEELKIIIPSDPSGAFTIGFRAMEEDLATAWGDDVEFIWTGNCANGVSTIENINGPWISIWNLDFNLDKSCKNWPTKDQILAVDSSGLRLCVRGDSELTLDDFTKPNDKEILLGHSTPAPVFEAWVEDLNLATGANVKNVPYNSSGRARRGLLAGDVDAVFITTSNSNRLMNSGNGKCIATTHPDGEERYGMPALKDAVDFPFNTLTNVAYYFSGNMNDEQTDNLRDFFSELASGSNPEMVKFQKTLDIELFGADQIGVDGMYDYMEKVLDTWKPLARLLDQ